MNREAILSGNSRQYISVKDVELLGYIERLLPHYTTFNKLLNDALRCGLPILLEEKENGEVTLLSSKEERVTPIQAERVNSPEVDDKEMKNLLSQIVMNTSLNKAMLSGLFNLKEKEIFNPILASRFKHGELNNIPDCLFDTQIDMLKEISKDEENE